MRTRSDSFPTPGVDEQAFRGAVKVALDSPGGAFVGSSWHQLQEYGRYQEPGLEFTPEDETVTQLYAALAVYSRALMIHADLPESSLSLKQVIEHVSEADLVRYSGDPFPYCQPSSPRAKSLPPFTTELVTKAARDPIEVMSQLEDPALRHEWTVKPGKRIFTKLIEVIGGHPIPGSTTTFLQKICGPHGYLERFEQQGDTVELTKEIGLLIFALIGFHEILLPIAVTTSVILVRRGLGLYCGGHT